VTVIFQLLPLLGGKTTPGKWLSRSQELQHKPGQLYKENEKLLEIMIALIGSSNC